MNSGHLLENMIFMAVRSTAESIFYYRTKNCLEVDSILQFPDCSRKLIQMIGSLHDPDTGKREVRALTTAIKEQNIDTGTIVTLTGKSTVETERRRDPLCGFSDDLDLPDNPILKQTRTAEFTLFHILQIPVYSCNRIQNMLKIEAIIPLLHI